MITTIYFYLVENPRFSTASSTDEEGLLGTVYTDQLVVAQVHHDAIAEETDLDGDEDRVHLRRKRPIANMALDLNTGTDTDVLHSAVSVESEQNNTPSEFSQSVAGNIFRIFLLSIRKNNNEKGHFTVCIIKLLSLLLLITLSSFFQRRQFRRTRVFLCRA